MPTFHLYDPNAIIMLLRVAVLVLFYNLANVFAEESPIVTLTEGRIKGTVTLSSRYKANVYSYLGIPYAAKPIGYLRFQPPQSPAKWNGILDCTKNRHICYQTKSDDSDASEDCLYLNVNSPVKPGSNSNLPVIVNFYGGAFINGGARGGHRMAEHVNEKGVIVVTMNYRIGPFGFLSTGDNVIAGNMGLKDQLLALKWVQRNIHLFGGDPKKVTIMGQSAGSASVTYHLLSPQSSGLFRAAIGESGSALCTWAYQRNAVDTAYGIAAELNSSFTRSRSTSELNNLLISVSAEAIHRTSNKYKVFAPVIETEHDGAFITQYPYQSVLNGNVNKVPLIIGYNSEESLAMSSDMAKVQKGAKIIDTYPYVLVNDDMNISNRTLANNIGSIIKTFYGSGTFESHLGRYVQYYSDITYIRPTLRFAELYSGYSQVYIYEFSYHGKLGGNNYYVDGAGRVAHGEEKRYFWSFVNSLDGYPAEDILTLDRFLTMLTNFVKYLNPTPNKDTLLQNVIWPTATSSRFVFMEIDKNLSVSKEPRKFSYRKWVTVYEKYAQQPRITY